jgi:hypothetical protein
MFDLTQDSADFDFATAAASFRPGQQRRVAVVFTVTTCSSAPPD